MSASTINAAPIRPRYSAYTSSSVDWLGDIPAHWQVRRLRFVCDINPPKAEISSLSGDTEVSFLPMEYIGEDGSLLLEETRPLEKVWQGFTYFRDGDIVVAKITPTAPGRVRTAYILVDDIIELALKSYLQAQAFQRQDQCVQAIEAASIVRPGQNRRHLNAYFEGRRTLAELCNELRLTNPADTNQLQLIIETHQLPHWTVAEEHARKLFHEVVQEVKGMFPLGNAAQTLLDHAQDRRVTRNRFFHDPNQSGLTIHDETCLRALCDLFALMEALFPDFRAHVQHEYGTLRCQIGVLRLKLAGIGSAEINRRYEIALDQLRKGHEFDVDRRSLEHSILHTVSDRFFVALREEFRNEIGKLQTRVDVINSMSLSKQGQKTAERDDKLRIIGVLNRQLTSIETLLGTP